MDRSSLQDAVGAHTDWFHCIDLGNGVVTPGTDGEHSRRKLELIDLPASLRGMRVLDVGCCEGFFSFAAEQRGAERVVAIDTRPATLAKLDLCRRALGSRVESLLLDVAAVAPQTIGTFDLVFCFAVLHHLRHPLLAFDRLASVTHGVLLIEVVEAVPTAPTDDALLVRRRGERGGLGLLPNRRMLLELLERSGFGDLEVLGVHRRKPVDPPRQLFGFEQQRVLLRARRSGQAHAG